MIRSNSPRQLKHPYFLYAISRSIVGIAALLTLVGSQVDAANVYWTGSAGTDWTVTGNWDNSGGGAAPPGSSDLAVFDFNKSPSNFTPALTNTSQSVSGIEIVNNGTTNQWTITGTNSTLTLGSGGFAVSGGGTATINTSTLDFSTNANQSWFVATGTTVQVNSRTLLDNAKTITSSGGGLINFDGEVRIDNPSSVWNNNDGTTRFNGTPTFKSGSNKGQININNGSTAYFNHADYAKAVSVAVNQGTLGGVGAVNLRTSGNTATVGLGSIVSPGDPTIGTGNAAGLGTLTLNQQGNNDAVLFASGANPSRLLIGIRGDGTAGNDTLVVGQSQTTNLILGTGTTSDDPILQLQLFGGTTPVFNTSIEGVGDAIVIVTYTGTRTGIFQSTDGTSLTDGKQFSEAGYSWTIRYLDATKRIVLTAVPEPASLVMLGIAAVGAGGYGWRRRKQRLANLV